MVFKDYKIKAVKALINSFNAEHENDKYGGTIHINNVYHCNTNSVEIDSGLVYTKRYIDNRVIITGGIAVEDINSMYYVDDMHNIVSLENMEY